MCERERNRLYDRINLHLVCIEISYSVGCQVKGRTTFSPSIPLSPTTSYMRIEDIKICSLTGENTPQELQACVAFSNMVLAKHIKIPIYCNRPSCSCTNRALSLGSRFQEIGFRKTPFHLINLEMVGSVRKVSH